MHKNLIKPKEKKKKKNELPAPFPCSLHPICIYLTISSCGVDHFPCGFEWQLKFPK